MPRGDGTGPAGGGGPGTGRGGGRGRSGGGMGGGGGRGQGPGGGAYGPSGFCLCVACKTRVPHQAGVTCTDLKCPQCGKTMVREELYNDRKQS